MDLSQALHSVGLTLKNKPIDNIINRCPTIDKPFTKNGAFIPFTNILWYTNMATGVEGTIKLNQNKYNPAQMKKIQRIINEEKYKLRQEGIMHTREAFTTTKPLGNLIHPYMAKKKITNFGFNLDKDDNLVIPVYNIFGELTGFQKISKNLSTKKMFEPGTAKASGFFCLTGKMPTETGTILLAEGVATAASMQQAVNATSMDVSVVCCFDSGNVDKVYKELLDYGYRRIWAIKDNDQSGMDVKCPGTVIGCEGIIGSDANDYCCKYGEEALNLVINDFINGKKEND